MSVIVKGMKMPTDCDNCPFFDEGIDYPSCNATGYSRGYNWNPRGQRMPDCPLTEIPQHGRLIDADLFSKVLKGGAAEEWNQHTAPFSWSYAYECLIDKVGLIPTVIPAEEEGEA